MICSRISPKNAEYFKIIFQFTWEKKGNYFRFKMNMIISRNNHCIKHLINLPATYNTIILAQQVSGLSVHKLYSTANQNNLVL